MPGETILVVDDEAAVRELLDEILSQAGFRVLTAGDGLEALTVFAQVRPQLVISDVGMPGMDGYQLYEQVRSRPEWVLVPFVFLTGLGDDADVRRGKGLGADDYLVKPFREDDLLLAVRARLARHAQLETAREAQVEELKQTILRTLNHELRTPLTYLSGYAEILRESGAEMGVVGPLKEAIDGILAGSDRLSHLVEDLLTLVDLDSAGAQQAHERRRRPVNDLPRLLKSVLQEQRVRAGARRIQLLADVPSELPPIVGDAESLGGAVRRLLDNAIKFSKEGGEVTLRARAADGRLRIEVRDRGVGMPASELGRISDLFYQFDRRTQEQQGSGLGLTIVRGIVALHGGTLDFESEVGIGFAATIELSTSA
ncbi:MAG TPA: response regulator [Vicinamibacteria bacterium]|nr:response regulator [Vicinamibacteria bacterium]